MHSRVDLTNIGHQESFVTITRTRSNADTIFSWKYDLDMDPVVFVQYLSMSKMADSIYAAPPLQRSSTSSIE